MTGPRNDPRMPWPGTDPYAPQIPVSSGAPTVGVTQGGPQVPVSQSGTRPGGALKPPSGQPMQPSSGLNDWLSQYQQSGGAGMSPYSGPENGGGTNAWAGGSPGFNEAAGPGLPPWAGGPQQGPMPPGYTFDPSITGGVTQTNPFTGSGAMTLPTYQPTMEDYARAWAEHRNAGPNPNPANAPTVETSIGVPAGTGPGPMTATIPSGGGAPIVGHSPPPGATGAGPQTAGLSVAPGLSIDTSTPGGPGWANSTVGGASAIPGGGGGPSSNTPAFPGGGGMIGGVYYPPGSYTTAGGYSGSGGSSGGGGWNGGGSNPYGINPADVANPNPQNAGNWREFEDNAYAGFTRQLDPQFAEIERSMRQDLANRGIPEGSAAWVQAMDDFNRGRNDAYGSARQQSQAMGLQAQNQFFTQNALESQLANALLRSQWDLDARMAGIGAQNRSTDAQLQQALASLGLQRDLGFGNMGLQRELGLHNIGLDYDRLGFAQDQAGFGNLMQLLQFGFGANQYNNQLLNDDFGRGLPLFGFAPNVSPSPIDVTGPYAQQQNWAQFLQGNANQAQNGYYGGLGQTLGMLPWLLQGQGTQLPSTYGPQAGGYGYPQGYGAWNSPWMGGMNYGQWPGG